jgi:hypothetical protein
MAVGWPRSAYRSAYRSKPALGLALASMAIACRGDPQVTLRSVTLHAPKACAPDGNAYATYQALGDNEPISATAGHLLKATGESLPEIDAGARALLAHANENGRDWAGVAGVPAAGDVNVLLLPQLASCALSTGVGPRSDAMLAPVPGDKLLVVGGMDTRQTPRTFIADWTTGTVEPARVGLVESRTRASVTAFGDGALVAGGIDDSGTTLGTAEVFEPSLQGFDQSQRIDIGSARADHGAVVLVSGETLLVGGVGADGKTPLASMQTVDPSTRTVRTEGIARLAVARRAPSVLRLASGEVLVAGGFDQDNAPVATLEWFAPDASQSTRRSRDLATGAARGFIPLEGGGALAIIAPPPGASADFQNTWVLDADGALEAAAPVQGTLTTPVLFSGTSGAPALWTGDRWLRWLPWQGAFGALDVLDDEPAQIGGATCSPETGVALWIAADAPMLLTALRFGVASEYEPLPGPLLVTDTSETAPDRLPTGGLFSFDPTLGLVLSAGTSAFVTDRTYADFSLDIDATTGEPALIVLRDELGSELEVGGPSCPAAPAAPGAIAAGSTSLHVMRKGPSVVWSAEGKTTGTCSNALRHAARVSIGVRAPASTRSVVRNLRIVRLGP